MENTTSTYFHTDTTIASTIPYQITNVD